MSTKNKRVIISLANERGNYRKGMERLYDSLRRYSTVDLLFFKSEAEVGAPSHLSNPYAFKVHAFQEARSRGYDQILWLDASVYAVATVDPIFEHLTYYGHVMQDAGHLVGEWCNDRTLEYWGLKREQANVWKMYGNAGMLGLDFNDPWANAFFRLWKQSMLDGQFIGSWDDHRHDMVNGSIAANLLKMYYFPGDQLLQYAAPEDPILNDSIIFKAQGL